MVLLTMTIAAGMVESSAFLPRRSSELPLELVDRRTATSKTYALGVDAQGRQRYSVDLSISPIHYKAPWKGVTAWTAIVPGWTPAAAPWDWQSTQAEYDVHMVEDVTAGEVIEWCRNTDCISLQPMSLQWTNDLSQISQISMPVGGASFALSGTTVSWAEVYGPNTRLAWTLENMRLRKELSIVAASLPTPPAFILSGAAKLDLWVNGALWDKKTQVSTIATIEYRNASGATVFYMPAPQAWDAISQVPVAIALKKSGPSLYVSVRTPYSWLSTTTGTVTIDPTLDLQVGAATDDARARVADTSVAPHTFTSVQTFPAGLVGDSGLYRYGTGMRWLNVTLQASDTITVAYITVTASGNSASANVNTDIYGENADNSATYSTDADYNGRAKTAVVVYDGVESFTLDSEYNTPSLVTPVTTIKNRVGWTSGNAMGFKWEDGDSANDSSRGFYSYDNDSTKAPKLHIEYTAGGGPAPTPTAPAYGFWFSVAPMVRWSDQ